MSFSAYHRLDEHRYRERFGLAFEDFQPGQHFVHRPGITMSQQDNCNEALATHNGAMLHFDAEYAAATSWQRPLMVSTLTVQRLLGMACKTLGRRRRILGFEEITLSAPLFGGDTLYAESSILEVSPGDDADIGLVTVQLEGIKGKAAPDSREICARVVFKAEIYRAGRAPDELAGAPAETATAARFAAYREQAGVLIEQVGLFFEDAAPGETFIHSPRHSFYREDIVAYSRHALDLSPQYHDLAWIDQHQRGRYQVPESLLLGAVTALTTRTLGRVSANLGWTETRFAAVYAQDTIEAESTIVEKRESKSRPHEGVFTVDTLAHNQAGERVCSFRRKLLVYKRDGLSPYAQAGY